MRHWVALAGNWLEVKESVECLEGKGPADLRGLVIMFAAHLLAQTKRAPNVEVGCKMAVECLDSGRPRAKWNEMLAAQGADMAAFEKKLKLDHTAPLVVEMKAARSGFVADCDARIIGEVVRDLGGGRLTKETVIHPEVGVDRLMAVGDAVNSGTILCRVHVKDEGAVENALAHLQAAFKISEAAPKTTPLICEII